MQAMLTIWVEEMAWDGMPQAEQARMLGAYGAYVEALKAAGVMRGGERLAPVAQAATVRIQGGVPQVLDGPYAETREQLGGYFLLEVADMDEAIRWAARCPGAEHGAVEVRPLWPDPATR